MNWLRTLFSGKPHFIIGDEDTPYLLRWYLIPRNRYLNFYLHKFMRDDDDRALHDHPWWFVSLVIKGGYFEMVPHGRGYGNRVLKRSAPSVAYRPATHQHRVVLHGDPLGKKQPCWTIVMTGRKKRTWGFWCPKGFVPWYEFVDQRDAGKVGKGCED